MQAGKLCKGVSIYVNVIMSYHAYQRCLERGIDAAAVIAHIESMPLMSDVKQVLHMDTLRIVIAPDFRPGDMRIKTIYEEEKKNRESGYQVKRRRYMRDRT